MNINNVLAEYDSLFGNTTSRKVTPSVGAEQEYFLIDKEKWKKRN